MCGYAKFGNGVLYFGKLVGRYEKASLSILSTQCRQTNITNQTYLSGLSRRFASRTAHSDFEGIEPPPNVGIVASFDDLNKYSAINPQPVSMKTLLNQGKSESKHDFFMFLRKEMPVRLANMIMEFQHLPPQLAQQDEFKEILQQYHQSFSDMLHFQNKDTNPETQAKFLEYLTRIRARHADTVPTMAAAIQGIAGSNIDQTYINYFLDRLYLNRISIHMLISYYKALHSVKCSGRLVGTIDPHCDVVQTARNAFEDAAFMCDREYIEHPDLDIISSGDVTIPYVPSHLHHIFFEIFKNAMRATCEVAHQEKLPDLEDIKCKIFRSNGNLTIKISDQGGGIDRDTSKKIFDYHFTTAGSVGKNRNVLLPGSGGLENSVHPMHGLGYGLPLSRLYTRYFQGDIEVSSLHGYGTDVYIYLQALSQDAMERLPVYGPTAVDKMKRSASTKVSDWTQ